MTWSTSWTSVSPRCRSTSRCCAPSTSCAAAPRGVSRLYRLNGPALAPVQSWLERYTTAVNDHYDRLDDYLVTLQRTATTDEHRTTPNPTTQNPTEKEITS